MKDQSTFSANWTFGQDGNWTMDPKLNEGYPAHQWADKSGPSVKSLSPENGSENVELDTDLVVTFDEMLIKGSGNITLYKSDNTKIKDFDVNSDKVTISGNQVTINPSSDLEYETNYYVKIDAGCFKDAIGNNYSGINDNTTWNFLSKFEPISFKPADGTAPADIRFVAAPMIDANKTVNFIGFQLASNYEMTQNIINLKDNDAEERGYILLNWNDYICGQMYYYRYAVRYTDGTEDYGPVSAFIRNEGTGVIKIGE